MAHFKNFVIILCLLAVATPIATACPRFFARHRNVYNGCGSRVTYCQPMATYYQPRVTYCQPRVTYSNCQPTTVTPEVKKQDCPTCNTVVPHLVKFEGPEQPVQEEKDELKPVEKVDVVKVTKQRVPFIP